MKKVLRTEVAGFSGSHLSDHFR